MERLIKVFLLVCFMLVGTGLTVSANGAMYVDETQGVIKQIMGNLIRVAGEGLTAEAPAQVWVDITTAQVYDLKTGFSINPAKVQAEMSARVAYIVCGTNAPYQAIMLWLHANEDDAAVFTARVSQNIQYSAGYCTFMCADGKYRITLTDNTCISDPWVGALDVSEIVPGQEFFIWVDSITASCPALVYPEKVVRVR